MSLDAVTSKFGKLDFANRTVGKAPSPCAELRDQLEAKQITIPNTADEWYNTLSDEKNGMQKYLRHTNGRPYARNSLTKKEILKYANSYAKMRNSARDVFESANTLLRVCGFLDFRNGAKLARTNKQCAFEFWMNLPKSHFEDDDEVNDDGVLIALSERYPDLTKFPPEGWTRLMDMDEYAFTNKGITALAKNCKNLTSLRLDSRYVTDEGMYAFAKHCKLLDTICIYENWAITMHPIYDLETRKNGTLKKVTSSGTPEMGVTWGGRESGIKEWFLEDVPNHGAADGGQAADLLGNPDHASLAPVTAKAIKALGWFATSEDKARLRRAAALLGDPAYDERIVREQIADTERCKTTYSGFSCKNTKADKLRAYLRGTEARANGKGV